MGKFAMGWLLVGAGVAAWASTYQPNQRPGYKPLPSQTPASNTPFALSPLPLWWLGNMVVWPLTVLDVLKTKAALKALGM